MSAPDADAERSYTYPAHEITGRPLLGMTLAGADRRWSARFWSEAGEASRAESVRIVGDVLDVSWNDDCDRRRRFRTANSEPPRGGDRESRR